MFRVKCPICKGLLVIDTRTRRVVGHTSVEDMGKGADERFESIVEGMEKAKSEQEKKLEAAKAREAERARHLDDLFNKAQEKAKDADPDKPVGPVWD